MLDPLELYPFKLFAHWTFLEALKESVSNKRKWSTPLHFRTQL